MYSRTDRPVLISGERLGDLLDLVRLATERGDLPAPLADALNAARAAVTTEMVKDV